MSDEKKDDNAEFDMGKAMAELAEIMRKSDEEHGEIILPEETKFPLTVNKVDSRGGGVGFSRAECGQLVQVKPCGEEYEGKTFLGIYLGSLPIGNSWHTTEKSKELRITLDTNPAMFVPELKKIIWGCGSWWGKIESEEQLSQITDKDIEDVWYVKLLREMQES